jgi:TPR repeat protein
VHAGHAKWSALLPSEQQDMDHAIALWRHSAAAAAQLGSAAGLAAAAANLAVVFLHGHGVACDVLAAADWYSASLEDVPTAAPLDAPRAPGSPEYISEAHCG